MAEKHTYYIAHEDKTYGEYSDELHNELKNSYLEKKSEIVSTYDGASFYIIEGKERRILITNRGKNDQGKLLIDVVDI